MKRIILILSVTTLFGCGGGMYTKNPNTNIDGSYTTPWGNVTITKDAFILASDYPADIVIPDIEGMRSTAFIVSMHSPSGVIAVDLNNDPLAISENYEGLVSPSGTGFPVGLTIYNNSRAFLLTSSHIIDFNPKNGEINTTLNIIDDIIFDKSLPLSNPYDVDKDGSLETEIDTITLGYPAHINIANNKIYVTFSNYINPILPAIAGPGIVGIYNISESSPYLEKKTTTVTTNYNPTGLTLLPDGNMAITNSGVSDIVDASAVPVTESSIDIIDTKNDKMIANIPLGLAALSFKEMAIDINNNIAYIGSASFGEIYAIDLQEFEPIYSHDLPYTITGNEPGSNYLSALTTTYDSSHLFVASFDDSAIYPLDLRIYPPKLFPETFPNPFTLGFPKGVSPENPTGTNTGIGDIAIRPGIPNIDYTGPDLFVITGFPGTIVSINTSGTMQTSTLQIKNIEIVPNLLDINKNDGQIQLGLKIKFGDESIMENIISSFTNPFTGYEVPIKWSSLNTDIATISGEGVLSIINHGETIVTATIGQTHAESKITISEFAADQTLPPEENNEIDESDITTTCYGPNCIRGKIPRIDIEINSTAKHLSPELTRILINNIERWQNRDNIEILTSPPEGYTSFPDSVTLFNPGDNAGFGQNQMPDIVLGPPEGSETGTQGFDVVSLGRNGEIILEFEGYIIANGTGPDFTIFENVFFANGNPNHPFSEPGIVSVSVDGINFVEFECEFDSAPFYPGCAGTTPTYSSSSNGIDPLDPAVSGGNSFDLADIGFEKARFVKIRDSGIVQISGEDNAGFDLDAIAILNGTME